MFLRECGLILVILSLSQTLLEITNSNVRVHTLISGPNSKIRSG